jgi:hypothetical protein
MSGQPLTRELQGTGEHSPIVTGAVLAFGPNAWHEFAARVKSNRAGVV